MKRAAEEFLSKEHELHILFNNACIPPLHFPVSSVVAHSIVHRGVMLVPVNHLSKDGYDLQWATNVLGHFYLTELLVPTLIAGVSSSPDHHARVVTTASSGAYFGRIRWDTLKDSPARRQLRLYPQDLYFQSKLVRTHMPMYHNRHCTDFRVTRSREM